MKGIPYLLEQKQNDLLLKESIKDILLTYNLLRCSNFCIKR